MEIPVVTTDKNGYAFIYICIVTVVGYCTGIYAHQFVYTRTGRHFYTRRNFFGILLNQTGIRLYLPFPVDLEPNGSSFGSKSIGKW